MLKACYCASILGLYEPFTIEDFLIPLIFQDKFTVAKEFLDGSRNHQICLVKYLDDLLGKKNIKLEAELALR